ncbi:MTAP family purine nucleoside phosphorylase [Specibacter cremeus]|uniref:MTAP family purine nucleoside phosphorylase n=1 Tax=Specibacter cremeus TaxID=1629051 RepID=UPI000F7B5019|nr:MTAP family purine nucleoside phosphorylase [Specibacter cremeus]
MVPQPENQSADRPPTVPRVRLGIIGGTGLYRLPGARILETVGVDTPFGAPSSPVTVAELPGVGGSGPVVAFLARHGHGHTVAPQQINYRANLWALRSLGVAAVLGSSAVGALVATHRPGSFAVPDQFMDRTWGRADTFYDGTVPAGVQHLPAAEPYCPRLRTLLHTALGRLGEDFRPAATVAVIKGPRFSTRAESAAMAGMGAHLVSMTAYPEPVLAAELNMGFATLAFVTDADTGHDGSEPVTAELVLGRLAAAQPRILRVLAAVAGMVDDGYRAPRWIAAAAVAAVMNAAPAPGHGPGRP